MKKIVLALAAAASFASAPAHATFWVQHGGGDYGCGGHGNHGCESPLQGEYTYDGKGGDLKDATKNYKGQTVTGLFTSTIKVNESFTIADVNLSLNELEHDRWSDLLVTLSHGGVTVILTKNQGGDKKADGTYIFDDEALNLIGSSGNRWKEGTYNPFGELADFNGLDSAGLWTLSIYDSVKKKSGELCDWTLQLTPETPTSEVPEPATWLTMIAGFGLVGVQLRRRRHVPATVRA